MVDIVSHIRPLDTLQVAESPFAKVVKSKDVALLVGIFNQRKRESKWRDIRLRKAVNHAINREELKAYAAKGNAYNLGGFVPAGARGHNPSLRIYDYDTEKARSLLTEGGYPRGFKLKIITYQAWKLEAQIIAKMLERIGLKVTLEFLEMWQIFKKIHIGSLERPPEDQDWDIVIWYYGDWFGHTAASFLSLPFIENGDMRWTEYDPTYEGMWEEMARTVDPAREAAKIRKMVNHVYNQANWIFIYSPLTLYAVKKEVDFVPQKNYLLRLKETSVTENHWSLRGKND
jgi:peptide/nickel transport system substrate-binding protein